jgi:integrase
MPVLPILASRLWRPKVVKERIYVQTKSVQWLHAAFAYCRVRDRAILATLLYHGLRRAELCALRLVDLQDRRGVRHLQMHGKGSKIRYVPLHPADAGAIAAYLEAAGHGDERRRHYSGP